MSFTGVDDPTYNAFADDERFQHITSAGFYSSAFLPPLTLRRRQSPSLIEQGLLQPERHSRARTEIQIVPPNSAGLHPLKSALAAATFDAVLPDTVTHVTRPNLSRIVGWANVADVKDGELTSKPSDIADEERDVIVHQVCILPSYFSSFNLSFALSGNVKGFSRWCCCKVWYHSGEPPKSKSALDIRLHPPALPALYPNRPGFSCTRIPSRASTNRS